MFDWAKGSILKKMIKLKIPFAGYDTWLRGWAWAWPLAFLSIPKKAKILDVGTGSSLCYPNHFVKIGCETHVLDGPYKKRKDGDYWGISKKSINQNPKIQFHLGLAGEYKGPANKFDMITCISVIEHIYDSTFVLDPKNPYPHLDSLADMARMLSPGGLLVLTYDFMLNDMPHWRGWDYLADYEILKHMGLYPLIADAEPKSRTYIYNHEDTLFMGPEGILSFADSFIRSTSIGMIFIKPGAKSKITFQPHSGLTNLLFSKLTNKGSEDDATINDLKKIVVKKTKKIAEYYINRVKTIMTKSTVV